MNIMGVDLSTKAVAAVIDAARDAAATGRLKHLRLTAGMSRNDVAAHVGCHVSAIYHWENGCKTPSPPYAYKLGILLNLETQTTSLPLSGAADAFCPIDAHVPFLADRECACGVLESDKRTCSCSH